MSTFPKVSYKKKQNLSATCEKNRTISVKDNWIIWDFQHIYAKILVFDKSLISEEHIRINVSSIYKYADRVFGLRRQTIAANSISGLLKKCQQFL